MNRKQYHLNSSGKKPILFSPLLGLLSCNIDGVESCHLFQQANMMDQQKLPQSLLYSYQGCKTFYSSVVAVHTSQAMDLLRSAFAILHFLTLSPIFQQ